VKHLAVIGVLGALVAAGTGVGTSSATFTAHSASTATIGAASDWVAPGVTLTTPADGTYQKSSTIALAGAAGNATGDGASVTVNVYAGSTATGTPVTTRTVTRTNATWSTTLTNLAQGTYTAQATQSDSSSNTATSAARTFTIDSTPPTRVSISAVNGTGTAGHLDAGDVITFTYSEPITPSSILSTWSGAGSATVNVRFFNVSSTLDGFTVLDSNKAANVKLDAGTTNVPGVTLGTSTNYVTNTVNFTGSMTRSADGKSFVIVLAGNDASSKIVVAPVSSAKMTWTPKAGPTDLAGNALTNVTAFIETDTDKDF
jgi:hypothetical protein